jgi:hypothetical protein
MSLLSTASPWITDDTSSKKRIPTMKKPAILRPFSNNYTEQDEYINQEPSKNTSNELPPTIQDVQNMNEVRNTHVSNLINKITSLESHNDGERLVNFNPLPRPTITKQPVGESRNSENELQPSELLPNHPLPPRNENTAGNYSANDNNLGKLSNYRTSYERVNLPYYAKMGIGSSSVGDDKFMEKINYMIHLLEEQKSERTNNITEEFILYTFLGVFIIYIVDSFARSGKYVR